MTPDMNHTYTQWWIQEFFRRGAIFKSLEGQKKNLNNHITVLGLLLIDYSLYSISININKIHANYTISLPKFISNHQLIQWKWISINLIKMHIKLSIKQTNHNWSYLASCALRNLFLLKFVTDHTNTEKVK